MIATPVARVRLSRFQIQSKVVQMWDTLFPNRKTPPLEYPVDEIIRELVKRNWVEFVTDQTLAAPNNRQRYGEFTILPRARILVHSGLSFWGPRFKATLAHEIGHFVLHRKLLSPLTYISTERPVPTANEISNFGKMAGLSDHHWIEWQANEFMAALLLPKKGLMARVALTKRRLGLRPGPIYIDRQGCTQVDAGRIIAEIALETMIQHPIVKERLFQFDLIDDRRFNNQQKCDSVKKIVSDCFSSE